MTSPVLVLGGGVTGMRVATSLGELGHTTVLLEKAPRLGGRVTGLSRTFPFFDHDGFNDGKEFTDDVEGEMRAHAEVDVRLGTTLVAVEGGFPEFRATFSDGTTATVSAVVIATGFEPFDPSDLEEYGYGRYANVVTGPELEWIPQPPQPERRRPPEALGCQVGGEAGHRVLRGFT